MPTSTRDSPPEPSAVVVKFLHPHHVRNGPLIHISPPYFAWNDAMTHSASLSLSLPQRHLRPQQRSSAAAAAFTGRLFACWRVRVCLVCVRVRVLCAEPPPARPPGAVRCRAGYHGQRAGIGPGRIGSRRQTRGGKGQQQHVRRKQAVRPCLSTPAAPAAHPRPQPLT
jgi:hypothetical protein